MQNRSEPANMPLQQSIGRGRPLAAERQSVRQSVGVSQRLVGSSFWDLVSGDRCVSIGEMTSRPSAYVGTLVAAGITALCICAFSSCGSRRCGGQRTLVEKYVGYAAADSSSYVSRCFGPTADCVALCEEIAIDLAIDASENGQRAMVGSVVLGERTPSPDGWADGGYSVREDAGYIERVFYDGGTVDPKRILHLVAAVAPACGE